MLDFFVKSFSELSTYELYDLLRLRNEIFVLEQKCSYLDIDGIDYDCKHVLGYYDNKLVAYTRIVEPDKLYPEPAIGRVLVDKNYRKLNFGKQIMLHSIKTSQLLYPKKDIIIGAQSYLLKFYTELGFIKEGEDYLEDAIPHNYMRYKS